MNAIVTRVRLKWLFAGGTLFTFAIALLTPFFNDDTLTGNLSITVILSGLTCGLAGCWLMLWADEGISAVNLAGMMVLWVTGIGYSTLFLVVAFVTSVEEPAYELGLFCGMPTLLMPMMTILLYRYEIKRIAKVHLFEITDPEEYIKALKSAEFSPIATRLTILLGVVILIIILFAIWVVITPPSPS